MYMNVDVQEVQVQVTREVNKNRYLLLLYLIFIVLPVMISGQNCRVSDWKGRVNDFLWRSPNSLPT